MRLSIILAVLCMPLSALTTKDPPNCSPRPCTYTITCASQVCTPEESAEVQAAINDARLGDTIRLQAGRLFTYGSQLLSISARQGSGYLTITTTGSLPPPGVRITPHWRNELPTITNTSGPALSIEAAPGAPATNIIIRGVRFIGCKQPLVRVGQNSSGLTPNDAPDDITFDQILMENENWSTQCGSYLRLDARRASLINSWAAGAMQIGGERQAVSCAFCIGPFHIENNYLADVNGENIMFGGTGPFQNVAPVAYVRHNALYNHPERLRFERWAPNMVVFKGKIIRPTASSSPTFEANNSGITGASEPSWPSTMGATVSDGTVTWRLVSTGTSHLTVKNNFEIKNCKGCILQYNHIRGMWVDGQYQNVVYKLSNCPAGTSSNCGCVPYFTGLVNTSGTQVTSADGKMLPDFRLTQTNTIRINGVDYTVADWTPGDPYTLVLSTSAGNQTNVTYTYGTANCIPAWDKDSTFENNLVENGPLGYQITAFDNAFVPQVGNIVVRNNIFNDIDPQKWSAHDGSTWNARDYIWLYGYPPSTRLENNTVIGRNASLSGLSLGAPQNSWPLRVVANIWPATSSGVAIRGGDPTQSQSQALINDRVCFGTCTEDRWDRNVMAGTSLTSFTVGKHWNLCSSTSSCSPPQNWVDPVHGPLFHDVANEIFKTRHTHPASTSGARFEEVPFIQTPDGRRGVEIVAYANSALFQYRTTAANQHIPCSLEISTTRDMDSRPALPLSALYDSSDAFPAGPTPNSRTILVTGLTASTTYYYRLHCGVVHAGSFVTTASQPSGNKSLSVNFIARAGGSYRLEYGTSYSRQADAIYGGGVGNASSCSAGQQCSVSAIVPQGFVFYRVTGPVASPVAISY